MAKDLIARIVVDGSPYEWRGAKVVVETSCSKASELIRKAVNSNDWPSSRVLFTVTLGGFIQAPMPNDYQGLRSWKSRPDDFQRLVVVAWLSYGSKPPLPSGTRSPRAIEHRDTLKCRREPIGVPSRVCG